MTVTEKAILLKGLFLLYSVLYSSILGISFMYIVLCFASHITIKPVLSGHSTAKILKTYYRLMQVKSIADCTTFDMHQAIIRLEDNNCFVFYLNGCLRQVLLYCQNSFVILLPSIRSPLSTTIIKNRRMYFILYCFVRNNAMLSILNDTLYLQQMDMFN